MKLQLSVLGSLITLVFVTGAFYTEDYFIQRAKRVSADVEIEKLPQVLGDWRTVGEQGLELKSRQILNLDRFLKRSYQDSRGRTVHIYVGYWKMQTGDSQAAKHSPRMCLPSNGWIAESLGTREIEFPNSALPPLKVSAIKGDLQLQRALFYYWFFTGGDKLYAQDWRALLNISMERFITGRSDGGLIEITTNINQKLDASTANQQAQETLTDFTRAFFPVIWDMIKTNPES